MRQVARCIGIAGLLAMAALLGAATCEKENDSGSAPSRTAIAKQATISPDQAQSRALSAVPGGMVTAERIGGAIVYQVTAQPANGGQAEHVEVDASTGTVLIAGPARGGEDSGD